MTTEVETGMVWPQSKECQKTLEEEREKLELPYDTLISGQ